MEDLDKKFVEILKLHSKYPCPECGRELDRGDVSWNNSSTEYGTPFSTIEIICQECENSILHLPAWYPWIENFEDVIHVLEEDWE